MTKVAVFGSLNHDITVTVPGELDAVALGEGCDVYEAALRGNAAGSWAVRVAGAEPSMPTRAQLEHVLRSGSPYAGGQ